jgi:hypothetical protein
MMAAYGEEEEGGQIDEAEWQDEDPEGNAEMQREIALKLGKKSKGKSVVHFRCIR